jgi:hypothetical protein
MARGFDEMAQVVLLRIVVRRAMGRVASDKARK